MYYSGVSLSQPTVFHRNRFLGLHVQPSTARLPIFFRRRFAPPDIQSPTSSVCDCPGGAPRRQITFAHMNCNFAGGASRRRGGFIEPNRSPGPCLVGNQFVITGQEGMIIAAVVQDSYENGDCHAIILLGRIHTQSLNNSGGRHFQATLTNLSPKVKLSYICNQLILADQGKVKLAKGWII